MNSDVFYFFLCEIQLQGQVDEVVRISFDRKLCNFCFNNVKKLVEISSKFKDHFDYEINNSYFNCKIL